MRFGYLLVILFSLTFSSAFAQEDELLNDSAFLELQENPDIKLIQEKTELDPQRSALLSAILPGLGQIYNRQYWKVPIVVSGFLLFGRFIYYNNQLYHAFRNAVILVKNGQENPFENIVRSEAGLIQNRDNFRRNRDFMIILGTAFYLLQIVDAHVSAHLNEFEVNEDLAISIEPTFQTSPLFSQAVGGSIVIRF